MEQRLEHTDQLGISVTEIRGGELHLLLPSA
jgi:hypothetical protein